MRAKTRIPLFTFVLCTACTGMVLASAQAENPGGAGENGGSYGGEAPDLKARVEANLLPPLAQRLPVDPFVVEVIDRVGKYGGTWRRAIRPGDAWAFWGYVIKENEIRYDMNVEEIIPVIWKDYQVSEDKKTFTFYLRHGLRWSDGVELTAGDYVFWWEHIINNEELTPIKPSWLMAGGNLPTFTKIDEYTVRFHWATPYGIFLHALAQPRFNGRLSVPSHYLKQFHPAFTSQADLKTLTDKGGFGSWTDLFASRNTKHLNPDLPGLEAWVPIDDNTGSAMRFRRNPFYWKVDPEGNQLPYIDTIEQLLIPNPQACLLRAMAGEIDFQYRVITGLDNYTLFQDVAETVGIRTLVASTMHSNIHTIFLNYTTDDPVKAQLYGDFRFRLALSLAIDREEINTLLHKGFAPPAQVAPPEGDRARVEAVAKIHTEFDLARADRLLDEIGLIWDERGRFRLGPDGQPLQFVKIFSGGWPANQAEAQDLIKASWAKVGIDVMNRPIARSLWTHRMRSNDYDMAAYATNTGGGAYLPIQNDGVFPINRSWFPEPDWGHWYATKGAAGTPPPKDVGRSMALYDEYTTTAGRERMIEIEKEAFALYSSNLWAIGVCDRPTIEVYYIANVKLQNLPQNNVIDDFTYFHPAQLFFAT